MQSPWYWCIAAVFSSVLSEVSLEFFWPLKAIAAVPFILVTGIMPVH